MKEPSDFELESAVRDWRDRLSQSPQFRAENLNELEAHLRDSIASLRSKGLSEEEAFLIATRRIGTRAALEPEFAKVNAREVWLNRALWMLIGIQGWSLMYGLTERVSRWLVISGLMGSGYNFGRSAYEVSFGLVVLFIVAHVMALLLGVWVCWRMIGYGGKGLRTMVSKVVTHRGLLAVAISGAAVLMMTITFFGYAESIFLVSKLDGNIINAMHRSANYSWWFLWPAQTIAFLFLTAVLARRLFARNLRRT